jgi:hypothetical protein
MSHPPSGPRKVTDSGGLHPMNDKCPAPSPAGDTNSNAGANPAPTPNMDDPAEKASGGGNRSLGRKMNPKDALGCVVVWVVACIGAVFVAAIGLLLLTGMQFNETQLHGFNLIAAVVTVAISYIALGRSHAVLEGTRWGVTIRIVGPLSGALCTFIVLSVATPAVVLRTAWVYLSVRPGAGSASKIDGFSIRYRGQQGPLARPGQKGAALVDNLSWKSDDLAVDAVECAGFLTAKQHANEAPPWKYPIEGGEVTIEMVKAEPEKDPMPDAELVRALMKAQDVSELAVRGPGKYKKKEVSLRIENGSDRPIDFVCFDCIAAIELKDDSAASGKPVLRSKDERNLQPATARVWGSFDKFHNPSGWFALFVRYEDHANNRIAQQALGVYNLFNTREAKLYIERDDDSRIGSGSILGGVP